MNLIVHFFCHLLFFFQQYVLRPTFVNVCGYELFLLTVQIYHHVLITSVIDGRLGCVKILIFLRIINAAMMSILVCDSWYKSARHFLDSEPEVEYLCHLVCMCPIWLGKEKLFQNFFLKILIWLCQVLVAALGSSIFSLHV